MQQPASQKMRIRAEEMIDMAGNLNDIMNMYQQFSQNPISMLSKKFNIPQNVNSPNDIIQHLLNSGQVTQDQVNRAMQMRNHPMIQKLMNK